ncbi:MAG TPA: hypothetical protein EYP62_02995, partial [Kiritimatiellae bacterium]|nr:hypothetical protein [Kiritimatiellia bacterium]
MREIPPVEGRYTIGRWLGKMSLMEDKDGPVRFVRSRVAVVRRAVSFAAVGVWLAQGAAAADYFVNDASTNGDV